MADNSLHTLFVGHNCGGHFSAERVFQSDPIVFREQQDGEKPLRRRSIGHVDELGVEERMRGQLVEHDSVHSLQTWLFIPDQMFKKSVPRLFRTYRELSAIEEVPSLGDDQITLSLVIKHLSGPVDFRSIRVFMTRNKALLGSFQMVSDADKVKVRGDDDECSGDQSRDDLVDKVLESKIRRLVRVFDFELVQLLAEGDLDLERGWLLIRKTDKD